jgi:hypothetical protein
VRRLLSLALSIVSVSYLVVSATPASAQKVKHCLCLGENGCGFANSGCQWMTGKCNPDLKGEADAVCQGPHSVPYQYSVKGGGQCGYALFSFTCDDGT